MVRRVLKEGQAPRRWASAGREPADGAGRESGVTVFSPFAADTDYFAADKILMLNFRVADLDAMIAQLKSADIEVSHESEMEGIGRFARIHDPEGNAIELWEPAP